MSLSELLELPEIVRVVPSGEFDFSRDYVLDKFDFSNRDMVFRAFEAMADYLDAPYIVDIFESHEDRRVLIGRLSQKYLEIYENNALRAGRANMVCLSAQILTKVYLDTDDKTFFDLLSNVLSFRESFSPSKYDSLRPDEKLSLAYSFKEKVHGIFKHLEDNR